MPSHGVAAPEREPGRFLCAMHHSHCSAQHRRRRASYGSGRVPSGVTVSPWRVEGRRASPACAPERHLAVRSPARAPTHRGSRSPEVTDHHPPGQRHEPGLGRSTAAGPHAPPRGRRPRSQGHRAQRRAACTRGVVPQQQHHRLQTEPGDLATAVRSQRDQPAGTSGRTARPPPPAPAPTVLRQARGRTAPTPAPRRRWTGSPAPRTGRTARRSAAASPSPD